MSYVTTLAINNVLR